MLAPFIEDQLVANEAALDIGPDWATLKSLPNNATLTQIQETLDVLANLHSHT